MGNSICVQVKFMKVLKNHAVTPGKHAAKWLSGFDVFLYPLFFFFFANFIIHNISHLHPAEEKNNHFFKVGFAANIEQACNKRILVALKYDNLNAVSDCCTSVVVVIARSLDMNTSEWSLSIALWYMHLISIQDVFLSLALGKVVSYIMFHIIPHNVMCFVL